MVRSSFEPLFDRVEGKTNPPRAILKMDVPHYS
jgi:hypothetical protein